MEKTKESSIGITVVEAVLKKGFYYAKLGGVPLYGVEKDSFRISKEINQTPSFEMEIANCSENREEILNGITEEFKIYWRHHGEDTHVFTGIINADGIEYVSLDSIQISGFASYVKLSWPFHKHLADEDKESVNTALTYNGISYSDKTTPINNATINDVLISFGGVNHAFYIGENQPFWGMETKYSTKGVPGPNLLDSMDAVTGWSTDGAMSNITVNVTEKKEGTGALNLIKALTSSYNAGILKAISSVDLESKDVMVWLFLKDATTKNKLSVIEVNLMDSGQNEAEWHFSASSLSVGWNLLTVDTSTPPDYSDPSVDLTDITEIQLYVNTNQATDTYAEGDVIADYYRYISYTDIIVLEYSKGSGVWDTLDVLDESNAFTEDPGTYNLIIPHPPSDWGRNTVNGIKKYWIRYRVVSGSYSTEPKLDQAFIVNVDIYRTYYFNTSAREILLDVLGGTEYTMDSTDSCPEDIISIVADYQSPLRLIAAIPNALTWIDTGDDNKKKAYQWWIDDNKKVHMKGRRGTTYPDDITGDLTIFNNQEDYFHLSNQLWGLGPRDGLSQMRAMIRDTSSIGMHGLREIAVSEEQIANYNMLKTSLQKKIAISKDPMQRIRGSVSTQFWGIKGYEVGDTVTLHQEKWHVPNKGFQIVKVDMGPNTTTLDLGISQDHLEGLRDNMQRQLDLNNVRMHGSTTLLEAGPATSNYQRIDTVTVYPAKLEIDIPSTVKKIHKVLLSWTLGPYRASVGPNTGEVPPHDHDGWVGSGGGLDGFNAGAGGAFTPGVNLDGAFTPQMIGGMHQHGVVGYVPFSLESDLGFLPTSKTVSSESSHTHTNPTTGTASQNHTHSIPATDGPDDTRTVIGGEYGEWAWGTACTLGSCVDSITGVSVADSSHWHLNTGKNSGSSGAAHTHSQGVTGSAGGHNHTITTATPNERAYVWDVDLDYVEWTSENEGPIPHAHTGVDYLGHDHDGIAEPAHSDHAIPAEPPHTDHAITSQVGGSLSLDYDIYEVAGNTDMELLVNGESVGTYATAPQTEIRIDGWLNSGNNTIELQPKVGENNKKGGATLVASGLLFVEPVKF